MNFMHIQQNMCLQEESYIEMIIQKTISTENKIFNSTLSNLIFMPRILKQAVKTIFYFSKIF